MKTKDIGADPAFVASPSSREGVSTKGFNRGESEAGLYATMWWIVGNSDLTSEVNQRARAACRKARGES